MVAMIAPSIVRAETTVTVTTTAAAPVGTPCDSSSTCAVGLICHGVTGLCAASTGAAGAACISEDDCSSNMKCSTYPTPGKCYDQSTTVASGGACVDGKQCATGLLCGTGGTCVAAATVTTVTAGGYCSLPANCAVAGSDCSWGYTVCRSPLGSNCTTDDQCSTGTCSTYPTAGKCYSYYTKSDGASCVDSRECTGSGSICKSDTNTCGAPAAATLPIGAYCASTANCATGLTCSGGFGSSSKCAPVTLSVAAGGACVTTSDCAISVSTTSFSSFVCYIPYSSTTARGNSGTCRSTSSAFSTYGTSLFIVLASAVIALFAMNTQ